MIRNLLIVSIILNSILVMTVVGVMPFFLFLSLLVIIGLVWFIYHLINKIENLSEDIEDLFVNFYDLSNHLESIHELEMFYGEPVLQDLMDHTKEIINEIESYKTRYDMMYEQSDDITGDENDDFETVETT